MRSGTFYIVRFYGSGNFGLKYGRNYGSITIGYTDSGIQGYLVTEQCLAMPEKIHYKSQH
jgi:hypothetical protein